MPRLDAAAGGPGRQSPPLATEMLEAVHEALAEPSPVSLITTAIGRGKRASGVNGSIASLSLTSYKRIQFVRAATFHIAPLRLRAASRIASCCRGS
jgi:hypothetical protein